MTDASEPKKSIIDIIWQSLPLSAKVYQALTHKKNIEIKHLQTDYVILDLHASIEFLIRNILLAFIAQTKDANIEVITDMLDEKQFSRLMEYVKVYKLLDITNKEEHHYYNILCCFNKMRNDIAHRNVPPDKALYSGKNIYTDEGFNLFINDLSKANEYLDNKFKKLRKQVFPLREAFANYITASNPI